MTTAVDLRLNPNLLLRLKKKYDSFLLYLSKINFQFDVIVVTETWLRPEDTDLYHINGYASFFSCRVAGIGGGVAIFVNESLSTNPCCDLNLFNLPHSETLFIDIVNPAGKSSIIGAIYRSPNSNINSFNTSFSFLLNALPHATKNIYLTGDFNINLLNESTHSPTSNFIDLLFSHHLLPTITKPTRITSHSATLIDNIFTNNIDTRLYGGILITDISDHLPNFLISSSTNTHPNVCTNDNYPTFSPQIH
jgi:exonuclease III